MRACIQDGSASHLKNNERLRTSYSYHYQIHECGFHAQTDKITRYTLVESAHFFFFSSFFE